MGFWGVGVGGMVWGWGGGALSKLFVFLSEGSCCAERQRKKSQKLSAFLCPVTIYTPPHDSGRVWFHVGCVSVHLYFHFQMVTWVNVMKCFFGHFLPLIQEGHLSVSGKRTILVNRLED